MRYVKRRLFSGWLVAVLVSALLVGLAPAAEASSHSEFTSVADSYVESHRPLNNYGSSSTMRTDASPVRNSYLKFDVQGQGPVTSAVLRIHVESKNNVGFEVRAVADTTWDQSTINYNNAPPTGAVIATSGPVSAGTFVDVDVSAAVTGDGLVSLALTSLSNTSTKYSTSEGANAPTLYIPGPPSSSPFFVTRTGSIYDAVSSTTGQTYSGTLKFAVESAANELSQTGGGVITFDTGTFDLGSSHLEFYDLVGVTFQGQGIDVTIIQNSTSAATDTEPFDFSNSVQLTIRDMTVFAGGSPRSTSDALDFDGGDDSLVERVKISGSRGRGIVFDGKETSGSGTANRNTIRDCSILNVPGDGIELLASSENTVQNCTIVDAGGHGIQLNKASSSAEQPNKQSSDNVIAGNTITNSGQDGVNINSGDRNQLTGNTITNSSDDTTGRDGIRLASFNGISCNANEISGTVSTDNQPIKTQRYGLNIHSSNCNDTVIGTGNDFSGNLTGDIRDVGTNTQYPADTDPPTAPGNLTAPTVEFNQVDLAWDASTDNVGVTGYTILRDGSPVGSVGGGTLTYSDTTVAPNTNYTYAVQAEDAAGNFSPLSNAVAVLTPPTPSSFTINPVADAYVNGSSPTANYGTSTQLRADASPVLRSYVRFDVSDVPAPITSATLRVFAASNHNAGFEVRNVDDDSWVETTMNFNTSPATGGLLGSSGQLTAGTWVEIDVTAHVTGNGTYSLAFTPLNNTNLRLDSREAANQPELVIQTS